MLREASFQGAQREHVLFFSFECFRNELHCGKGAHTLCQQQVKHVISRQSKCIVTKEPHAGAQARRGKVGLSNKMGGQQTCVAGGHAGRLRVTVRLCRLQLLVYELYGALSYQYV